MWTKIKKFFKDSEVIFWSDFQIAIGFLAAIIVYVDPQWITPIIGSDWAPYVVLLNGIATKYLRYRRDPSLKSGEVESNVDTTS